MNYEDTQPESVKGRTLVTVGMDGQTVVSTVEAIPGMEVCDFCSEPNPTFAFQADRESAQVTLNPDGSTVTHVNDSGWAACGRCAIFIQSDDRKSLGERSIKKLYELHPDMAKQLGPKERAQVEATILEAHQAFFSVWSGREERL